MPRTIPSPARTHRGASTGHRPDRDLGDPPVVDSAEILRAVEDLDELTPAQSQALGSACVAALARRVLDLRQVPASVLRKPLRVLPVLFARGRTCRVQMSGMACVPAWLMRLPDLVVLELFDFKGRLADVRRGGLSPVAVAFRRSGAPVDMVAGSSAGKSAESRVCVLATCDSDVAIEPGSLGGRIGQVWRYEPDGEQALDIPCEFPGLVDDSLVCSGGSRLHRALLQGDLASMRRLVDMAATGQGTAKALACLLATVDEHGDTPAWAAHRRHQTAAAVALLRCVLSQRRLPLSLRCTAVSLALCHAGPPPHEPLVLLQALADPMLEDLGPRHGHAAWQAVTASCSLTVKLPASGVSLFVACLHSGDEARALKLLSAFFQEDVPVATRFLAFGDDAGMTVMHHAAARGLQGFMQGAIDQVLACTQPAAQKRRLLKSLLRDRSADGETMLWTAIGSGRGATEGMASVMAGLLDHAGLSMAQKIDLLAGLVDPSGRDPQALAQAGLLVAQAFARCALEEKAKLELHQRLQRRLHAASVRPGTTAPGEALPTRPDETLLHRAAAKANPGEVAEALDLLHKQGLPPVEETAEILRLMGTRDAHGRTPLWVAAEWGHTVTLKQLLKLLGRQLAPSLASGCGVKMPDPSSAFHVDPRPPLFVARVMVHQLQTLAQEKQAANPFVAQHMAMWADEVRAAAGGFQD